MARCTNSESLVESRPVKNTTTLDDGTRPDVSDGGALDYSAALPGASPQERARAEHTTKDELYAKARDVGVEGRSRMSKAQLIRALRD